jgi:hypothetical protein
VATQSVVPNHPQTPVQMMIPAIVLLLARVIGFVLKRRRPSPLPYDLDSPVACSRCGHESGRHRSPGIANEDMAWWATLEMADRPLETPFGLMPCTKCECQDFQL